MLEFLNSSSEEEEDGDNEEFSKHSEGDNENVVNDDDNDDNHNDDNDDAVALQSLQVKNSKVLKKKSDSDEDDQTDTEEHSEDEYFREPLLYKDQHLYSSYKRDFKNLKQQYQPKWNTNDIIKNKQKFPCSAVVALNLNTNISSPTWKEFTKTCNGTTDNDAADIDGDWFKWKLNGSRRNNSNAYIQEIQRAIYRNTVGFPISGTDNYFKAAQNYAAYGSDFLDFPINLRTLWSGSDTSSPDNPSNSTNYGNTTSSPSSICNEESTLLGYNHFTKSTATTNTTTTTTSAISTMATSNVSPAGVSASTYYQICTGSSQVPRPSAVSTASAAAAYSMFFGNKITYVASTPNAPTLLYNAHNSSANTNFIPNSLANAALANASPSSLYSNPMLPNATQQYLNAFFKETQYLSTAVNATNIHGTAFYERLVYAQMLQQQIYHQTQQKAAAVAAMFQKRRPSAASLPVVGRNITSTAINNAATSISAPTTKANNAVVSQCNRHKLLPPSAISPDIVLLKNQNKHTLPKSAKGNTKDETTNGFKD